jgi:hypothetical protein
MEFSEFLNQTLAFSLTNLDEISQQFVDTARLEGPGAVVIEQTITEGRPKNAFTWERATEVRYLYGESYVDVISEYTPASPYVYLIIAQTQDHGFRAEVRGTLYQIHRYTYDLTLIGPEERRFTRTEPRTQPMLAQLTRLLGSGN